MTPLTKLERATSRQTQRQVQRQRQRKPRINPKDQNPPHRTIKTPQHSQHFNNTKHKAEYKPPDSNAEQNNETTRFESKNQGDGENIAKNQQTMSKLIDNGDINAANIVHEKAAETFSEFGKTSYELISQLDEDHYKEYIGKINDTWNNIDDMIIKIQNHISQGNSTTNFHTQDNKETTVAANSTADNSTTNNINTKATGQHQTSHNETSRNEQPETINSAQCDNPNSFVFDRLAY